MAWCTYGFRGEKVYLEVEDDCPNKSKNDGRSPVHQVRRIYVDQFNLTCLENKQ